MLSDTLTYVAGADWNYDIAGSTLSTPSDGDIITRFTATRAMTVKAATANIQADANDLPDTLATFKVWKNSGGSYGGTPDFTFTVSSAGAIAVTQGADVSLAAGDILEIEIDVFDNSDDWGVTLKTEAA